MFVSSGSPAQAEALNAGFVLNKMSGDQRGSYLAGVVEGMAISRFLRDKPDQRGMDCIYEWQTENLANADNLKNVHTWLARHPDRTVGALLYVLMKQDCGK